MAMQEMYRYSHETVARACHAVLSVMNDAQGPPWATVPFEPFDSLPAEEQGIWYEQVRAARRGATPRELFGQWAAARRALHWTWGPVRDTDRKTHPNLVAYDDLPASQRDKDKAFLGTVTFLTDVTPVLPARAGLPDAVTAILWKTAKVRHARYRAAASPGSRRRPCRVAPGASTRSRMRARFPPGLAAAPR